MQRRASQPGNRGLERIETIIEGQKSMPAKGNDDRLFFDGENGGTDGLRSRGKIGHRITLPPLGNPLWVDPVTASQCSQALLTTLYRSTDRLWRCVASV